MSTIKFIGRTTDFKGQSLWKIVSNLKNFGVGRYVVRSRMERYPEKSYMKILKVEALPEPVYKKNRKYEPPIPFIDEDRKCRVFVEKVFRGRKLEKPLCIESASYKADYRLLRKDEEAAYKEEKLVEPKLVDPVMDLPPLLREFISKEKNVKDPKMNVVVNNSLLTNSRLAKDGETPHIKLSIGLGQPSEKSKYLYEGTNVK